jgi:hypothetical protein
MSTSKIRQETDSRAISRRSAREIWLNAFTYWYLSGLLAALGFSFGLYFVRPAPGAAPATGDWVDAFNSQDGKWYKQIAVEGYHYDPEARSNVAFFPIYPLLGRAVMTITGLRAEVALLIVSNLSLLAALAVLAFYIRDRYPEAPPELSDYASLAAVLFPTGCFFRLTYSESTCFLLIVLAMYAMQRRWPLWAIALIVGLATASRAVGIALLGPFTIHLCTAGAAHCETQTSKYASVRYSPSYSRALLTLRRLAAYLPIACWGAAAFLGYQFWAYGDSFAVFRAHDHWGVRGAAPALDKALALATFDPIRSVYDSRSPAFWAASDIHGAPWFSLLFANPIFFAAGISLLAIGGWRRWLSLQEISLAVLLILIPYVTRAYDMSMGSTGRFVAVVFPIYQVAGHLFLRLRGPLVALAAALSGFFLATYAALYASGYLIF